MKENKQPASLRANIGMVCGIMAGILALAGIVFAAGIQSAEIDSIAERQERFEQSIGGVLKAFREENRADHADIEALIHTLMRERSD